jgi:hypothetical protein
MGVAYQRYVERQDEDHIQREARGDKCGAGCQHVLTPNVGVLKENEGSNDRTDGNQKCESENAACTINFNGASIKHPDQLG